MVAWSVVVGGTSCRRGLASGPAAVDAIAAAPPSGACASALRSTLRERLDLERAQLTPPAGGWTVESLAERWSQDANGYSFAAQAFALPRPADAIPVLRSNLAHTNPLTALEAATVLALLGDKSGLRQLREAGGMTQSGIEFFYARAALTLLGEPIPARLASQRCSIPDLERALHCP